jgi:hypothetical protein
MERDEAETVNAEFKVTAFQVEYHGCGSHAMRLTVEDTDEIVDIFREAAWVLKQRGETVESLRRWAEAEGRPLR